MRAVLDTNIFVSGIHWSGASEKVLRAWFLDNFKLISSTDIVDEFVKTMISFKVPMKIEDILWWESLILEKSELVMPRKKVNAVKDDPDDDKFIEAALEGKADYVVTQDRHLLRVKEFGGVKIVTPEEFLKMQLLKS
ncbi:putative toxin-antitoxin system toxin component, PIN family [Candidatus Woesearchaeota archaeon]|nr:putative toxin-antitoxin system toxin component, PIN family [Candidatus Woesearchaeota archaeon]